MIDLEMTRLCAEAMGLPVFCIADVFYRKDEGPLHGTIGIIDIGGVYDPLHDDTQAMALVKKFHLGFQSIDNDTAWEVTHYTNKMSLKTRNTDLNRAIVECVSAM